MFSTEEIQKLRAETPGVQHRIHFNNAGASFMPQPVHDTIKQHLELEQKIGGYEAAAHEQEAIQGFYAQTAKLLNTKAKNIAYVSSATDAYSKALSSITFQIGDVILTTRQDYVSNQIAFLQLQKRYGIKILRAANNASGVTDLNDFERLLKEHQPKLVAVTHIPTNSGLIQPIELIGDMCANLDTLYLVDACQSAGQKVLDVDKIKCDFLSVTMRKFMRGPRGAGFLYVSDKVLEKDLEPLFVDLKGASWKTANQYELFDSALRYELWEKPYALMLGSAKATEYALNIGIERIEHRVKQLAQNIRSSIEALGKCRLLDLGEELGGIVTITTDRCSALTLKDKLDAAKINTASSPQEVALIDFQDKAVDWSIRISPHYYNTEAEIEVLMEQLSTI